MSEQTIITYSYTKNSVTVTDTHTITVAKVPASLVISGASSVNEGASTTLVATVTYTDSTSKVVSPTNWASNNAAAVIGASTGIVTGAATTSTVSGINITCSYTEGGVTVNDGHTFSVVNIKTPVSIAITGPITINEGGSNVNYAATVTYDDTTTAVVTTSSTWSSDLPSALTIGAATGVATPAANIIGNKSVVLTVSYTEHGVTVTDTHNVAVNEAIKRPTSVVITGVTSINENASAANLVATVTYDDATTAVVTTSANGAWSSNLTSALTVGALTGVITPATNIIGNKSVVITYTYTENGATVNDTHNITVVDSVKRATSVVITGPVVVNEGSQTINLVATATYDDATNGVVTTSGTWSSSNILVATVGAATGVVTSAANVASDTAVTITFTHTANGATVNDTHIVTVQNVAAGIPLGRFGYGLFAGPGLNENGYTGPQQFFDSVLTTQFPNNSNGVEFLGGTGGDGLTTYGYMAYPVELGILGAEEFQDVVAGWLGGWEGIDANYDGAIPSIDFIPDGPNTFTFNDGSGARSWYIYRTDFPIPSTLYKVVTWPNPQ